MMRTFNGYRAFSRLALANWRELYRDPKTILYIMVPPFMILLFFWFFASVTDVSRPVTVMLPTSSEPDVQAVVRLLEATPKMKVEIVDEQRAQELRRSGNYEVIVVMPISLENGKIAIEAAPNSKAPVWLIESVLASATRKAGSPTVTVEASGDWQTDPKRFAIPGALVYGIGSLAMFGIAAPMVGMRQRGVLRLIGASPVSRLTFLLAQVPARLGLALVMIIAAHIAAMVQEPIPTWNLMAALGTSLLGFMMLSSVGYLVGGTMTSSEGATNLLAFLLPVSLMLSGVFIPLEIMPDWFQTLSYFVPLTYLGDSLRQLLVGAEPLVSLWVDYVAMVGTTVFLTFLAVRYFKWDQVDSQHSGTKPSRRAPVARS